jgi:hypothetical protein
MDDAFLLHVCVQRKKRKRMSEMNAERMIQLKVPDLFHFLYKVGQ